MNGLYAAVFGPSSILVRFAPLVGRSLLAVIFVISGWHKIMGPEVAISSIADAGLPFPPIAYAVAVLVEFGGGLLLILGYQARVTALALAVFTLVASFAFHTDFDSEAQFIQFMKNLAIIGGFLQIAVFGAGPFSLDQRTQN